MCLWHIVPSSVLCVVHMLFTPVPSIIDSVYNWRERLQKSPPISYPLGWPRLFMNAFRLRAIGHADLVSSNVPHLSYTHFSSPSCIACLLCPIGPGHRSACRATVATENPTSAPRLSHLTEGPRCKGLEGSRGFCVSC